VSSDFNSTSLPPRRKRMSFTDDFRRFFMRGLAAVMPTLITIWLVVWVWDFLWNNIGIHIIHVIRLTGYELGERHWAGVEFQPPSFIVHRLSEDEFSTRLIGVLLSVLLVYCIGVFVGNLIGRAFWRVAERAVLRIPLVRAIYPAVKQVTDFVLADRSHQFSGNRVVACQPHEQNIWSIGFVTGVGEWQLNDKGPEEMVTVFIPSSPTAISGYVLVVPRNRVVELPMTVEEAMRLLVSGGVIVPGGSKMIGQLPQPEDPVTVAEAQPEAAQLGKVG
jgi:uncharacterized membrane protein